MKRLLILILAIFVILLFIPSKEETLLEAYGNSKDVPSPADRIPEKDIHVYDDRVVINVDNPVWASFTDTNSMDPVFDVGANVIEIIPKSEDELKVGDIISYRQNGFNKNIIHRIIKIGEDEKGWYAIVKGDNNAEKDPQKVRFDSVQRVVVAIIY
ncbi:signal peptidase I [Candidatus Woesearchaeota archaeon]|nr:MAG: signal peptidase I [Candidatus Woesearchaeota archaeon]